MKVLFVSVEVSPFAKVGGLADVAGALPQMLRKLGHDARIVMPSYRMIENDPRWNLVTSVDDFEVSLSRQWKKRAYLREMEFQGLPVGFIGTDEWYGLSDRSETVYQPGCRQHLFFSAAVMRAMEEVDWIPDVIHCNDWHTGFLPVLMREKNPEWNQVGSVFTIHNLAYQGEFGIEVLDALDLPRSLFVPDRLETWGRVNFLKSGMVYADQTTTVSPNYAREIQTVEYGCSLQGLNQYLAANGRLSGILNGIDTSVFDPATDPYLVSRFTSDEPAGKRRCREALLRELGMAPIEGAPVMGVVSRLSNQKGMDLMVEAAKAMFELPTQLVVLGIGDPSLATQFRALEREYPRSIRFVERFDVPLAQRIYGGCDAFLMPSSFEPCGLGQLIAMRYGTLPVVRKTGGLADTVFEGVNGFVFEERQTGDFLAALIRMQKAFQDQELWGRMRRAAMDGDYGWKPNAEKYVRVYEKAIRARRSGSKVAASL